MVLTAVPGGAARVSFRPAARDSSMAQRPAGWWRIVLASVLASVVAQLSRVWGPLLVRTEPPRDSRASEQAKDPIPGEAEPPPPPAVVVVRRRPGGQALEPVPRGRRRRGFGEDPLDEKHAPRALRRAIDGLLGDIEERRDERRDEDRP